MKKFKILPILLILLMSVSVLPVTAAAVDEPDISAQAAILVDADSGVAYYSKNADRTVQPASTTKMMTALLVVEAVERGEISLADTVTASSSCQNGMDEDSSNAGPVIEPGETMTVEDLLYCAMLASANEACNILAEYVSGSISAFVTLMNSRAAELGCTNTHFANPNGLEDSNHYTTAADFALVAQAAVKNSTFLQICGTLTYTVPASNMNDARNLTNTNNLLNPNSDYYYEYAYGIKTGYFTNAGYCLVSAASYNDMNVICVVMGGADAGAQFADSLTLYDWLYSNYSYQQILSSTNTLMTVPVSMGTTDSTGVRAESEVSLILPNDYDTSTLQYQIVLYHEMEGTELEAPVNAGDVLGEVTVVMDGQEYGTSYLVATATVEMSRVEYLKTQTKELIQTPVVRRIITLLIILLAIYLLLICFYYVQRVRHLRSLREAKRERAMRQAQEDARWLEIPDDEEDDPQIGYFDDRMPEDDRSDDGDSSDDNYFDSFFKN